MRCKIFFGYVKHPAVLIPALVVIRLIGQGLDLLLIDLFCLLYLLFDILNNLRNENESLSNERKTREECPRILKSDWLIDPEERTDKSAE